MVKLLRKYALPLMHFSKGQLKFSSAGIAFSSTDNEVESLIRIKKVRIVNHVNRFPVTQLVRITGPQCPLNPDTLVRED